MSTARRVSGPERMLVLWIPDWPITAAAQELALEPEAPIALIDRGLVFASSAAARSAGVTRGMKQREAQYRAPGITVAKYDPSADARRFEPVVRAIELLVPIVQVLRPGLLALRVRGAARYFGSEEAAASELSTQLAAQGIADVRIGVAEGLFAAEQAARSTTFTHRVRMIPSNELRAFLEPLPVAAVACDERTTILLHRLGIHTLGAFAELQMDDVQRRFGAAGVWSYLQAKGEDPSRWKPRDIPDDLDVVFTSDTPLTRADEIAFSLRESADRFDAQLRSRKLVCTAVQVTLTDEHGGEHARTWLHPRWFRPAEVIDRVRWQLEGLFGKPLASGDSRIPARIPTEQLESSGIVQVLLHPERIDDAGHHEAGLWGGGPDERVHHVLTRVQSLLGAKAVGTLVASGGRGPAARTTYIPWGEVLTPERNPHLPWPGAIPGLSPATVYRECVPARLLDGHGQLVSVSDRGVLSAAPSELHRAGEQHPHHVQAWSQPWPEEQRWWDAAGSSRCVRMQVVDDEGHGVLLRFAADAWAIEAEYN